MLNSAIKTLLEPFGSLEEHIIRLLILRQVIPLITLGVGATQKIQGAVALRVVVVEAQQTRLLLLELLSGC